MEDKLRNQETIKKQILSHVLAGALAELKKVFSQSDNKRLLLIPVSTSASASPPLDTRSNSSIPNTSSQGEQLAATRRAVQNTSLSSSLSLQKLLNSALDRKGWKALHHACYQGHVATAQYLIEHKASLRARTKDGWQSTPLHRACAGVGQDPVLIDLLVETYQCPVDIRAKSRFTPLHDACVYGHDLFAKRLLELKANINARVSSNGRTPIFYAAGYGHLNVIKVLLTSAGYVLPANKAQEPGPPTVDILNIKDKNNLNPLQLAKNYQQDDIAEFLEQYYNPQQSFSSSSSLLSSSSSLPLSGQSNQGRKFYPEENKTRLKRDSSEPLQQVYAPPHKKIRIKQVDQTRHTVKI